MSVEMNIVKLLGLIWSNLVTDIWAPDQTCNGLSFKFYSSAASRPLRGRPRPLRKAEEAKGAEHRRRVASVQGQEQREGRTEGEEKGEKRKDLSFHTKEPL